MGQHVVRQVWQQGHESRVARTSRHQKVGSRQHRPSAISSGESLHTLRRCEQNCGGASGAQGRVIRQYRLRRDKVNAIVMPSAAHLRKLIDVEPIDDVVGFRL